MTTTLPFGPFPTPTLDLSAAPHPGRIGIAYSGGGDRIAVHLGIVQAFIEAGIVPQHIAGASAGAYASVFHALDPHSLDYLPLVTRTVQQALPLLKPSRLRIIFSLLPSLIAGMILGGSGVNAQSINSNRAVRRLLKRALPVKTFGELRAPVSVAATDLLTGGTTWFERVDMELVPALLASSAIPALFPPVKIADQLYVDGTVTDNLPLFYLASKGCQVIYACNVGYAGEATKPPANLFDTLLQSESIGQYVADLREQEILALRYPQIKVIPVRPRVALKSLPSDITSQDVPGIVAAAAAETRRILAEAGQARAASGA